MNPMSQTTDELSLPSVESTPGIQVTEKAAQKVQAFAQGNPEAKDKSFRVYVQGGGCSGFQYGFKFDSPREEDSVLTINGLTVLVDPMSLMYLKGSTVDYVESFGGSGFVVTNPNATSTCGCGTSFSA